MPKGEKKRKEWMVLGELALGEDEDPLAFAYMNYKLFAFHVYLHFMFIYSA
jgi:hypothetical protein